ncbi:cation-independent mannose-6-phosphate receptor [Culicoides brevitarsis]|uniref:cation-independent mannose-6-phosphate receptor n=1 Tax=Culicoides brevitarsis TaxID=469753 RepID=UPI00307CAE1A
MTKIPKLLIHCFVTAIFCCALSRTEIVTSDKSCLITDPHLNSTFDFTTLHSDLGHIFKHDNLTFKINVCNNDLNCSKYETPVAACEIQPDSHEVVLGYKSTLTWDDGRISFDFEGEQCTATEKYSLKTVLLCSYRMQREPIRVMPKTPDSCKTFAYWMTEAACHPRYNDRSLCVMKGRDGKEINLNQLYEMNHKVTAGDGISHFLINLCQPVMYGINSTCPRDSSICFVDQKESNPLKKFKNFGTLKGMAYEDDQYVVHYSTQEKCPKAPEKFIRTKIILECDREDEDLHEPVFVKETSDCELIFSMSTNLVCGVERACFAYSSKSNTKFDLTSLANRTFPLTHNGTQISYGICSTPLDPCDEKDGVCQAPLLNPHKREKGFGKFSTQLLLNGTDDHVAFVEYKDGDECQNGQKWRTIITFHCDETGKETSKIIETANCTLVISHPTKLMCSHSISCTGQTEDGRLIDLTRLKNHRGNFLAKVDPSLKDFKNYKFYLHVCRPLFLEPGLNCPGASACRTITVDGKEEHETSLGYPDVSLTMVNDLPVLKYLNGGICEKDNSTDLSTEIQFSCDPTQGSSVPLLTEVHEDCHYIFTWKTNKICDAKVCSYSQETCSLENADLKKSLDLRQVFGGESLPVKHRNGSININLCNKGNDVEEVLAQYKDDTVIFKFKAMEHKCNNSKTEENLSVVLQLQCGKQRNQSSFANAEQCYLELHMTTPLVCPMLGVNLDPNNDEETSTTTSMPPKHEEIIGKRGSHVTLTVFLVLTICSGIGIGWFYVMKSPERRHRVLGLFRRNTGSVHYSRVNGDADTDLLTVRTSSIDESDDDELII